MPFCRNPGNGRESQPSRRLSETTGQRSVSAFRVAFLTAEVTERRATVAVGGMTPGAFIANDCRHCYALRTLAPGEGLSTTGALFGHRNPPGSTRRFASSAAGGGTAADASGNWHGSFTQQDAGRDRSLLPKVMTGNFYSEYDGVGRMVGGFSANLKTE